jgi:hypothetical protein
MRKLLFVAIVTSFAVACKKDSNSFSYPSLYYANGIKDIQPVRAFTANGEIKNKAVTDRIETTNNFFLTQEALKSSKPVFDSIQFSSASEATLIGLINNYYRIVELSQSGNDLTLTALSAYPTERDTTVSWEIALSSLYYPALYSNKRNPSGPFYWYDFTEQYFAKLTSTDELIIPSMITMVPMSPVSTLISGPINNRFNPGFNFKLLASNDTFVVREYSLIMRKVH